MLCVIESTADDTVDAIGQRNSQFRSSTSLIPFKRVSQRTKLPPNLSFLRPGRTLPEMGVSTRKIFNRYIAHDVIMTVFLQKIFFSPDLFEKFVENLMPL